MATKAKFKAATTATESVVGLWHADTGEKTFWIVTRDTLDAAGEAERSEMVKRYSDYAAAETAAAELATRLNRRVIRTDEDGEKKCVFTPATAPVAAPADGEAA